MEGKRENRKQRKEEGEEKIRYRMTKKKTDETGKESKRWR